MEKNTENKQENKDSKHNKIFRIGIILNGLNDEDVLFYNEQLKIINSLYGEKIRIVVLGYKNENDKLNMFNGVVFEYIKPVSIIHYFKQLSSMGINILFIPLINNKYNSTSENYNKYLEAGVFGIPIITTNIYPYNKIIIHEKNGFIFDKKDDFIPYLRELLHKKINLIKECGITAQQDVVNNFNYSVENIDVLSSAFVW